MKIVNFKLHIKYWMKKRQRMLENLNFKLFLRFYHDIKFIYFFFFLAAQILFLFLLSAINQHFYNLLTLARETLHKPFRSSSRDHTQTQNPESQS